MPVNHERRDDVRAVFRGPDRELALSILNRVADKWAVLTVAHLARKPQRFTDLLENVPGISRRMLTVTLRQLERDGLVGREIRVGTPGQVDYVVTELGRSLFEPLIAVALWVFDHKDAIARNRDAYDTARHLAGVVGTDADADAEADANADANPKATIRESERTAS
jgi:DNA-binding HxlR family transcriptional regulator